MNCPPPLIKLTKKAMQLETQSSIIRSQMSLKRLIFSNAFAFKKANGLRVPPFFLTLTFSENVVDLKVANRLFSKFIQRFNYELFKVKKNKLAYVGVPQFQERGAVHYHVCLFNMPFHKGKDNDIYATIRRVWQNGTFINLKKINTPWGVYNYIKRYMIKNFEDGRLKGKKKYFFSRSCKRSIIVRNDLMIEMLMPYIEATASSSTHKEFSVDYLGIIQKDTYLMPQNTTVFDNVRVAEIFALFDVKV